MEQDRKVILDVEGMSCASCVRHVESALRDLAGVKEVSVQLDEGKASVRHDPDAVSEQSLLHALAEAGYPARVHG